MENNHPVQDHSKVSIERIIDSIRETRDSLIQGFLSGSALTSFLDDHFGVSSLSPIKLEFLKRDLKELQNSSLDLVHYSSLIKHLKEGHPETSVNDHPLVMQELKAIFQKYL